MRASAELQRSLNDVRCTRSTTGSPAQCERTDREITGWTTMGCVKHRYFQYYLPHTVLGAETTVEATSGQRYSTMEIGHQSSLIRHDTDQRKIKPGRSRYLLFSKRFSQYLSVKYTRG